MNNTSRSQIESFYTSLKEEKDTFGQPLSNLLQAKLLLTQEENNTIVGLAGINNKNMFFLVVKSSHQNRGIGQKLVNNVIRDALVKNYNYLALSVGQSNTKAIYIYKKLGFRPLYYSWKGSQAYLFMVLPLNSKGVLIMVVHEIAHMFFLENSRKNGLWEKLLSLWKFVSK
jgi:ribosomal protein S18 acetylase RimI-like enzyme